MVLFLGTVVCARASVAPIPTNRKTIIAARVSFIGIHAIFLLSNDKIKATVRERPRGFQKRWEPKI